MITAQVIHRTYPVKKGDREATGVVIDVEGRQYILTSSRLWESPGDFEIFIGGDQFGWSHIPVDFVGGRQDVCVLAPSKLLARNDLTLPITSGGLVYGQSVWYLGFPSGAPIEEWNMGGANGVATTTPYVKLGALASMPSTERSGYVDGSLASGFEGGPVVWASLEKPTEQKLLGIIVGPGEGNRSSFIKVADAGIALTIINDNPIGFELPAET